MFWPDFKFPPINLYSVAKMKNDMREAFEEWTNTDEVTGDNPYDEDSFKFWAWEGWCAAIREIEKQKQKKSRHPRKTPG